MSLKPQGAACSGHRGEVLSRSAAWQAPGAEGPARRGRGQALFPDRRSRRAAPGGLKAPAPACSRPPPPWPPSAARLSPSRAGSRPTRSSSVQRGPGEAVCAPGAHASARNAAPPLPPSAAHSRRPAAPRAHGERHPGPPRRPRGREAAAPVCPFYLRSGPSGGRGSPQPSPPPPRSPPVPFSAPGPDLGPSGSRTANGCRPDPAGETVALAVGGGRAKAPPPGASSVPRGGRAGGGAGVPGAPLAGRARARGPLPAGGARLSLPPSPRRARSLPPARCAFCPASRPVRLLTRRSCPSLPLFFFFFSSSSLFSV